MTITKRKRKHSKHMPVGRWIRPERRLAIYMRDRFQCLICEKDLTGSDPRAISLDHYKPRSKGGGNENENLYTACHHCNSLRASARPSKELRARMRRARKLTLRCALAKSLIKEWGSWGAALRTAQEYSAVLRGTRPHVQLFPARVHRADLSVVLGQDLGYEHICLPMETP